MVCSSVSTRSNNRRMHLASMEGVQVLGPVGAAADCGPSNHPVAHFLRGRGEEQLSLCCSSCQACNVHKVRSPFSFSPCLLHGLHRCIIPLMRHNNIINDLYRASHVLSNSTYWAALIDSVIRVLRARIVVLHNLVDRDEFQQEVVRDILDMTLLNREEVTPALRALEAEMSSSLIGDFTSNVIKYWCRRVDCDHGPKCKEHAVTHVAHLMMRAVFTRKCGRPTLSRWWKFRPFAEQILLGTACHNMWGGAAPRRHAQDAGGDAVERDANMVEMDEHRNIWNFRVRKTCDVLCSAGTPATLILILKAMNLVQRMMAWLMKHESSVQQMKPIDATGSVANPSHTRRAVALEWLSPVIQSLARASEMLDPAHCRRNWCSLMAFHRTSRSQMYLDISSSVLPVAARTWWKVMLPGDSLPLVLGRLCSDEYDENEKTPYVRTSSLPAPGIAVCLEV